jgi:hypothetical protein
MLAGSLLALETQIPNRANMKDIPDETPRLDFESMVSETTLGCRSRQYGRKWQVVFLLVSFYAKFAVMSAMVPE